MSNPRRVLALTLASVLALSSTPAFAEPSQSDREQARRLAAEGFEALGRKEYALAEARFRAADALVHAPSLVVDHARALVGLGRLVEAHERYELVLREGVSADAPWQWKEAHSDAARELEALKPRLAWLTVRVKGGPRDPAVLIDGKRIPKAALGVRRATDPGKHTVSASAPGFDAKEQLVTLDEGKTAALEFTLTRTPRSLPAPAPGPSPSPLDPLPPLAPAGPARDDTLAYVLFGAGALGLAGGAVSSFLFFDARADLDRACDDDRVCHPQNARTRSEQQSDVNRYRLFGTMTAVGFGIALVGAGAGGTLLLLGRDTPDEEAGTLKPYIGIGTIGLKSRF